MTVCQARRFVTLVDELYEHGVALTLHAAVPLAEVLSALLPHPALSAPFAVGNTAPVPAGVANATVDSTALSDAATSAGVGFLAQAAHRALSRLKEVWSRPCAVPLAHAAIHVTHYAWCRPTRRP